MSKQNPIEFLKSVPNCGILRKYWYLFPEYLHLTRKGWLPTNAECDGLRIKKVRARCCRAHHEIYILPNGRLFLSAHQQDKTERNVMSALLMMGQAPEKERFTRCEIIEKAWNRFLKSGNKSLLKDMPKEMRSSAKAFRGIKDKRREYERAVRTSAYLPEDSWKRRQSKYIAVLQDELKAVSGVWQYPSFGVRNFSDLYRDGFFYTTAPAVEHTRNGVCSARAIVHAQDPFHEKGSDIRTVLFRTEGMKTEFIWGRAQRKAILIQDSADLFRKIDNAFADSWDGGEFARTGRAIRRRFKPGIMREVLGWEIFEIGGAK
tara:strand:- start:2751 stop:3704 length:954 start_codon:yes stop_codon:yes gene_type:complete